jgi:hypothetical protein
MGDPFDGYRPGLTSPADDWFVITKSDTVDEPIRPRAVRANTAGDVVCVSKSGVVTTFTVAAGEVLTIRPVRINLTGTTATGLVGLY